MYKTNVDIPSVDQYRCCSFLVKGKHFYCLLSSSIEKSFEGIVPHRQKIKSGEAKLRFYGQSAFFCLSRKDNFKCIGRWKLVDLPKYGAVDGGFAFETIDSNSNDKKSMYFFSTSKGKEIHQLFDSVCRIGEPASLAAAASQGMSNK